MTMTPEEKLAMARDDDAYAIGFQDGYEKAVQDIDLRTGGDGEYFASTLPGRGCPDAGTMICRIVDRMQERVRAETAFQDRVKPWLLECFGPVIAADKLERCDRFIEEALELVQACDYDQARAHDLVDYVFGRPIGEPSQEVGGVMVTLAALCLAHHLDMQGAGETELARILRPEIVAKIRAKQAAKPTGSALPIAIRETPHAEG